MVGGGLAELLSSYISGNYLLGFTLKVKGINVPLYLAYALLVG
jgi:hypothetical protein